MIAVTVAAVRLVGPAVFSVRGDGLSPFVTEGDLLFARRLRSTPDRGAIVLINNFSPSRSVLPEALRRRIAARRNRLIEEAEPSRTVPRMVAAVPGDTVRFDQSGAIVIGEDGYVHRYPLGSLNELLLSELSPLRVGEEEVFLIATGAGYVDSRIIGPIPEDDVRFVVTAILWPAERRTRL